MLEPAGDAASSPGEKGGEQWANVWGKTGKTANRSWKAAFTCSEPSAFFSRVTGTCHLMPCHAAHRDASSDKGHSGDRAAPQHRNLIVVLDNRHLLRVPQNGCSMESFRLLSCKSRLRLSLVHSFRACVRSRLEYFHSLRTLSYDVFGHPIPSVCHEEQCRSLRDCTVRDI